MECIQCFSIIDAHEGKPIDGFMVCNDCIHDAYIDYKESKDKFEEEWHEVSHPKRRTTRPLQRGAPTLNIKTESTLTKKNLLELARQSKVQRFFGCRGCDFLFWRTCFDYKPVASCFKCKQRLDAIEQKYEIGKGYFKCGNCAGEWTSAPCRWSTLQPCQNCTAKCMVVPYKIAKGQGSRPRGMTFKRHQCIDCMNGTSTTGCSKHPNRVYSTKHDSTGSTITDITEI